MGVSHKHMIQRNQRLFHRNTRYIYVYSRKILHVIHRNKRWFHMKTCSICRYIYIYILEQIYIFYSEKQSLVSKSETCVFVKPTFVIQPPCTYGYKEVNKVGKEGISSIFFDPTSSLLQEVK